MSKRASEPRNAVEAKRPCASNALDFSTLPMVQCAVEHSQLVEYSCLTMLPSSDESSLEFRIDKTDRYTDLDRTHLYLQVQILNADDSDLDGADFCTFINNIGYALFDSVDVYIQDERVTKPESHYAFWTYLYNLLYYSHSATKYYLETGNLWYLDDSGRFNNIDLLAEDRNQGMKDRQSICGDSKKVWLCTKLMLNTQLTRLIPSQTEVTLKFHRSPTGFCLLAKKGKEYKIKICDAKLQVNRVKLFESAHRSFEKTLQSSGFFYPGTNPVIRTKTISRGDQNIDWTPISGKLPQRIYLFMIKQNAYNGMQNVNPYNFETFNLSRLQIFVNGRAVPYSQGITQLPGNNYLKFYMTTLASINSPESFKISYFDYHLGYFIVAVDLSTDLSAGCEYDNIDENGSLRIVADFKRPLEQTISFFCLAEVQEILRIDSNRKPSFL